jgi:hypothetical protein
VLAAFCLAWLQLAALPCADAFMLDATATGTGPHGAAMPATPVAHHTMTMQEGGSIARCPYCPPAASSSDDGAGTHDHCSYPHAPQVDSRLTLLFAAAVPVAAFVTTWFVAALDAGAPGLAAEPTLVPPRTPLAARPSRLIE